MIKRIKQYKAIIITFLVFSIICVALFMNALTPEKRLPVMNPSDVNVELVDTTIQHVSKHHTIADFSFTNQNGKTITQKDYEGKIYVADFFFTTCETICPRMTSNMALIQKAFLNDPNVMLLSHSVLPDTDTVPVLRAYADEKGVIDTKWNLVTGDKKEIYGIARKSYLAVKTGSPEELYDMVHTENFILVDTERRVRGFYDGTKTEDITRLIEDVKWLSENDN